MALQEKADEDSMSSAIEERRKALLAQWEPRYAEIASKRKQWFAERRDEWNLQEVC